MPQVIAGTASDLTKTISVLVKELLDTNWPAAPFDPAKLDTKFGVDTWDDYGDIQIHVNQDRGFSQPVTLGWSYSMVVDPVLIHLFVRANREEIPSNMGNAQRKIEEIVKDNAASLGQGVQMLRWDGWERPFFDTNLRDVWHVFGRATAIYWKAKTA